MNLHERQEEFKNLIELTSQEFEIRAVFIEKDYWVTYVLNQLSKSEFKNTVVFKGGTSLSKAFKTVDRFSEDVDLVLLEKEGMSGGQIKALLSKIEKTIVAPPITVNPDFKSSKGSKIRKTGYLYPKQLGEYDFGHAVETLIIELNAFANPHPVVQISLQSYIADFLLKKNDQEAINNFGLEPFNVMVLDASRTFTEKLLSLVRVSITDDQSYTHLREKVRHFYDIHKLFESGKLQTFLGSEEFRKTIELVLQEDWKNPEFKTDWVIDHLKDARLFTETENIFKQVRLTFEGDFQTLLYQPEKSSFDELARSLRSVFMSVPDFDLKLIKN